MKKCKDCKFCEKSMISDYIADAEIHRCSIDNDIIFNHAGEGEDCAWFERAAEASCWERFKKLFDTCNN